MYNLIFYCLGLELHEFYVETLWICTHCKLNKVDILALKNGERIFFEILWGPEGDLELGLTLQGFNEPQLTSKCLYTSRLNLHKSSLKPQFTSIYHPLSTI